ncbi:MAG: glycosyltransferase [Spirochaetia bacterium]
MEKQKDRTGNDRKKILLPYFLAGSGHIVSAQAIGHYLKIARPDWDLRFLEPADEFKDKKLDRYYRQSWKTLLSKPNFARFAFGLLGDGLPVLTMSILNDIIQEAIPKAIGYILGYKPDLIITTHWGCGSIFQAAREEMESDVPLFLTRNDLGGAYLLQDCDADMTFVMAEDAKKAFLNMGLPPEKIKRVNPLVRPQFVEERFSKTAAREKLDLNQEKFTLLLSEGGEGLGSTEELLEGLLKEVKRINPSFQVLVVTGRNTELFTKIERRFNSEDVIPLGYRNDMHILMQAADVIAGKCGANYTMETVMSRKPFIITQIGAPSEEYNKNFIVNNGYGWYAPTAKKLLELLTGLMKDTQQIDEKTANLNKLPAQNGAEEIAGYIVDTLER